MVYIKINYSVTDVYISGNGDAPVYIKVSSGDGGASGTVTSVDMTVPTGLTVSGNPITSSGTLAVSLASGYVIPTQATIDGKVPYSGATGNVDLGEYELKAGQIELDQTPTGTAGVAVTRWNDTIGSTETTLKGGSVVLKNGVDLVARVVNKVTPNATLTKAQYQAVRVTGAQGQRLAVAYAQANNDNNSADTIGLVTETIATNQEGFIITVGQLDGINTTGSLQGETWADGDVLYLSPTTPGALTNVKPVAPQHIIVIGYVEYAHANNGKIYVKVMNGWELGELHDVNTAGATNGQVLAYNGSIWVPTTNGSGTVTSITASAPLTGGTITSSGSIGITQASGSADGYLSSTDWTTFNNKQNALTNPITGSAASGQVAYFTGATTQAGSATFTFSPTAQLLLNNSVTAASAIARGANITSTLTAAANNDTLVGLDVNPTFTNGAFTGLWNIGARAITSLNGEFDGFYLRNSSNSAAAQTRIRFHNDLTPNNTSGTNGGVIFYTSSTAASPYTSSFGFWNYLGGNIIFATNNTPRAVIFGTGNLAINSTTDGGQRLQVNGTAYISGNTLIGSTSDTGQRLQVTGVSFATSGFQFGVNMYLRATASNHATMRFGTDGSNLLGAYGTGIGNSIFLFTYPSSNTTSAGDNSLWGITHTFNPTSGSANYIMAGLAPTINQTGGANGITRGIYVTPTLTAAADWRSIEWSNNTGWGLYGAGTAANYLSSRLSIATTNTPRRLNIEQANGGNAASIGLYFGGGSLVSVIGNEASTTDLQLAATTGIRFYSGSVIGNIATEPTNERMRLFSSTGNLLIQSGGTFTDGGQRLQVQGTTLLNGAASINGNTVITGTGSQVPLTLTAASTANNTLILNHAGQYNAIQINNNAGTPVEAGVIGWGNSTAGATVLQNSFYFLANRANVAAAQIKFTEYNGTTVNELMSIVASTGDVIIGSGSPATATRLTVSGSKTASSAIARGTLINTTLTAAANNDVLVGLDVNPTFTNGAFTGVANYVARFNGSFGSSSVALNLGRNLSTNTLSGVLYADNNETSLINTSSTASMRFTLSGVNYMRIFSSTGNISIQNGGTFTDAGFRLDVSGTCRVQDNLTVSKNQSAATILFISNATSNSGASAQLKLLSDVNSGEFHIGKFSTSTTAYKTVLSKDSYLYNNTTGGDISILNDFATGKIKFAAGGSSTVQWEIASNGDLTAADGENIIVGTTTGTKIGTATSQKIGFWNATPIVQPTTAVAAATRVGGGGTTVTDTDTFDGYTIAQIVKALRNAGLLA